MGNPDEEPKSPVPEAYPPPTRPPAGVPIGTPVSMYAGTPPPVVQPPPPYQFGPASYGPWTADLCDCFSDCRRSCGMNGAMYFLMAYITGCACIFSFFYRVRMRQLYLLRGSSRTDFAIHCCFESCALTQMYRELQNRGFDVSLGWHGNVERQTQGVAMLNQMAPPLVQQGMRR